MTAVENLMSEHRLIERAIDALAAFAEAQRRGAAEDRGELTRFVTFIREFADARHHAKEENVLFAALVEAGFPRQAGPVGVMLHEHDLGRQRVAALDRLARAAAPWGQDERQALAEEALGYGELLRAHIQKEDRILYPMALQRLPAPLLEQVEATCAALDARQADDGTTERLERLGRELVERHLPGMGASAA